MNLKKIRIIISFFLFLSSIFLQFALIKKPKRESYILKLDKGLTRREMKMIKKIVTTYSGMDTRDALIFKPKGSNSLIFKPKRNVEVAIEELSKYGEIKLAYKLKPLDV